MEPLLSLDKPVVLVQTYRFPEPAETGLCHSNVCVEPASQVNVTGRSAYVYPTPSTVKTVPEASASKPEAEKTTSPVLTNVAVSVIGPFMVMDAGLDEPVYEPEPEPAQLSNLYPSAGEAEIVIEEPSSYHPELGLTLPPSVGEACIVK